MACSDRNVKMVENLNSEFIKMLKQLQDSQNSIESLSTWCLENHKHYKSIISIWSIAIRKEKIKKRLIFFYLANHVIQYSKKKNYKFVGRWKTPIKNAIPYVRDESIQLEISRIIKIWDERRIYDVSYLINLTLSLVKPVQKLKPTNPVQEIQMNNNNKSSTYTTSSYETYKHTPMSSSHQFMTSEFSINTLFASDQGSCCCAINNCKTTVSVCTRERSCSCADAESNVIGSQNKCFCTLIKTRAEENSRQQPNQQ